MHLKLKIDTEIIIKITYKHLLLTSQMSIFTAKAMVINNNTPIRKINSHKIYRNTQTKFGRSTRPLIKNHSVSVYFQNPSWRHHIKK